MELVMEEGMILDTNGVADTAPRNSKRQRRPSVRLGEIGDVPLALFLENRPLKKKKKRAAAAAAAAVQSCPSLPDVVEEMAAEEDEDDDPTAVDMTGFHLQESVESPPSGKKTKALELLHDPEESVRSGDNGHQVDRNGNESEVKEPVPEVEQEVAEKGDEEKGGEDKEEEEERKREERRRRKKRRRGNGSGGKKGKKRSGSDSLSVKSSRASKVAAADEEDGFRKRKKVAESDSSLAKEDETVVEAEAREENEDVREEEREEEEEKERNEELEQQQVELEVADERDDGEFQDMDLQGDEDALLVDRDPDNAAAAAKRFDREEEQQVGQAERPSSSKGGGEFREEEIFVLPGTVRKWLEERRLGKYIDLFEFHEVDEEALPLLTLDDLREMGIHAIGSRRRMFHAILSLSGRRSAAID